MLNLLRFKAMADGVDEGVTGAEAYARYSTATAPFLQAVGELGEDLFLFHYGSYESHFFERMEARHGGDPALIARVKSRSVNVLSVTCQHRSAS